jgi:hypothetical protein
LGPSTDDGFNQGFGLVEFSGDNEMGGKGYSQTRPVGFGGNGCSYLF